MTQMNIKKEKTKGILRGEKRVLESESVKYFVINFKFQSLEYFGTARVDRQSLCPRKKNAILAL